MMAHACTTTTVSSGKSLDPNYVACRVFGPGEWDDTFPDWDIAYHKGINAAYKALNCPKPE